MKPLIQLGIFAFACLVELVIVFIWLKGIPHHNTLVNRWAAGIFISLVIVWFTAELCYGGGDPRKR